MPKYHFTNHFPIMKNLFYSLSVLTLLTVLSCTSDEEAPTTQILTDPDEISASLIFPEGTESFPGDIPVPDGLMPEGDYTPELELRPGQANPVKAITGARADGAWVQVAGASTYFDVPVDIAGNINTQEIASFLVQYSNEAQPASFDLIFRVYDNDPIAFDTTGSATSVLTTRIVTDQAVGIESFSTYERRLLQATVDNQPFRARDFGALGGGDRLSSDGDTTYGFGIEGISVQPAYDYESLFLRVYDYKLQDTRPGDKIPSDVVTLRYVRYDGSAEYETDQQSNVVVTVDQVDIEAGVYQGTFSGEMTDSATGRTFLLTDGVFYISNGE